MVVRMVMAMLFQEQAGPGSSLPARSFLSEACWPAWCQQHLSAHAIALHIAQPELTGVPIELSEAGRLP